VASIPRLWRMLWSSSCWMRLAQQKDVAHRKSSSPHALHPSRPRAPAPRRSGSAPPARAGRPPCGGSSSPSPSRKAAAAVYHRVPVVIAVVPPRLVGDAFAVRLYHLMPYRLQHPHADPSLAGRPSQSRPIVAPTRPRRVHKSTARFGWQGSTHVLHEMRFLSSSIARSRRLIGVDAGMRHHKVDEFFPGGSCGDERGRPHALARSIATASR